ncbi:MAG: HNH endonuclease [Clostridia bacterium]|nr:HNH endonuclease [Clostridia bacterium]
MKKPKILHNFYKSAAWQVARQIKYQEQDGRCERCKRVGEEVHHKIRLTIDNVADTSVSLNQENLELLCKDCHNKEHNRFSKEKEFDNDGNLIPR